MKFTLLLTFILVSSAALADDVNRPKIMLTGFWPPTNEMVREFSQDAKKNPNGWKGENFENSGYDVVSFFPEFESDGDSVGNGDFRVDFSATKESFDTIVPKVNPVALISFGQGAGPWEVETNATDYWNHRETLPASLPSQAISNAVNQTEELRAWVDTGDDAGDFLCGYLFRLGAEYKSLNPTLQMQGFIHVGTGYQAKQYQTALRATLRAVITSLKLSK